MVAWASGALLGIVPTKGLFYLYSSPEIEELDMNYLYQFKTVSRPSKVYNGNLSLERRFYIETDNVYLFPRRQHLKYNRYELNN